METKKQIRKSVLVLRNCLSEEERKRAALLVTERILGHQLFYSSRYILAFAGYGSEIDTTDILEEALRLGKKVYLPKVQEDEMQFLQIASLKELKEGYKGILEPDSAAKEYLYSKAFAEQTMMIMPGVAFDENRNRIGYGKGFYDKYLADKTDLALRAIAIGFQCQLVKEIPVQENDIRPGQIICC